MSHHRRNASHVAWEVIAGYTGTDGKPSVVLLILRIAWRKTLSLAELESGSQYIWLYSI